MIEAELLAQIAAAPDDVAPYLVYADWLQQRGDPRGRLIALQVASASPDEQTALIAEHAELAGPPIDVEPRPHVTWRYGFWFSLGLGRAGWMPKPLAREHVAAMLAAPSARLLRRLTVAGGFEPGEVVPLVVTRARTLASLHMSLGRDAFDDAALHALAPCTQLSELHLFSCERVTARGLAALRALPRLADLDLRNHPLDDAGVAHLAGLPLREVVFNAVGALSPAGMRVLAAAPLERLDLAGRALGDDHLAALAGHATLRELDVAGVQVGVAGARALGTLRALERLVLHGATLAADAYDLAALPALRVLDVGHAGGIDDAACRALARSASLRALDLGSTAVTGDGLRALAAAGMPLRALDLSFRPLTDADLAALAAFPDLEHVALGFTDLTDATVDVLARLPRLRSLDLSATAITADGVSRLAAHPALEVVGLYDCDPVARDVAGADADWDVITHDPLDIDLASYAG